MERSKNRINKFSNWIGALSKVRSNYFLVFTLLLIFSTESSALFAQNSASERAYQTYIQGDLQSWKAIIDAMEDKNSNSADFILKLTEYQYGYIAWCIGNNKKKEAKKYLERAFKNLDKLNKSQILKADVHAFMAAFYGFRIGLNPISAPINGAKSIKNAEAALEIDSTNIRANLEMGNIWYHMPKMFGGSDKKALKYYNSALTNIQKKENSYLSKNWMYLNILALNGQAEQKLGNTEKAMLIFEKALQVEPNFIWVKDELLPSLNKN